MTRLTSIAITLLAAACTVEQGSTPPVAPPPAVCALDAAQARVDISETLWISQGPGKPAARTDAAWSVELPAGAFTAEERAEQLLAAVDDYSDPGARWALDLHADAAVAIRLEYVSPSLARYAYNVQISGELARVLGYPAPATGAEMSLFVDRAGQALVWVDQPGACSEVMR